MTFLSSIKLAENKRIYLLVQLDIIDSYAIRDALESVKTPYVEIHLSNMYQRGETEHHRKLNVTAAMSKGKAFSI